MPIAAPAQPLQNVRHDLDPAVVADAVARKLADIDRHGQYRVERAREFTAKYLKDLADGVASKNWLHQPDSPEDVQHRLQAQRQTEQSYYAKVRVVELPREGNRFVLVYGDVDDASVTTGTGPFESFDKAVEWFVRLGR